MWRHACAALLLCAVLVDADPEEFKRNEMSLSPFVLSTRYGRSSPRVMSPRNDRFFMNGRYGKRSDPGGRENFGLLLSKVRDKERTRERWREKEKPRKWRPKCLCVPHAKYYTFRNYFRRRSEKMNNANKNRND